ncbi:MAG: LuxR C-terminal-related transcriptional regulator [Leptolyngbyaceae cyanobacterium MAG.088]|nr:LuxR C-terminal-related transcriptional regulator [Leptolyngbyaceae cyanobacterium MAG.088]
MTHQSFLSTFSNRASKLLSPAASPQPNSLVDSVLGNWMDGILILTEDGDCVESNHLARSICDRIAQEQSCINQMPREIWKACQVLIDSRSNFPNHLIIAESELKLKESRDHIRIRVRWFNFSNSNDPHILVILENQKQSWQNLAATEALRYDLSPREADVWTLHRIGYSYQEIAEELHIALNTVKKHMKNTYAKQSFSEMLEESYEEPLAG